jgi:hypothetical protein
MLRSLLNAHPDITCRGEVFNNGKESLPKLPTAEKLDEVLGRGPLRGAVVHMYHGWAGQQPIWNDLKTHTELFKLIPSDTTVIVLQRWNLLRRLVSNWLATHHHRKWRINITMPGHKDWRKWVHDIGELRVTIPAADVRTDIDAIRMIQSTRGLAFRNAYTLTYEQLCKDKCGQMRKVYQHIGADPDRCPIPSATTPKVGLTPLSVQLLNYAELKQKFKGTDLECYFDE